MGPGGAGLSVASPAREPGNIRLHGRTDKNLGEASSPQNPGGDAEPCPRKPHATKTGFQKCSVAPLEEVFPCTLQSGLDPGQGGQGREILPCLKALPIPGAQARFLCHLLLNDACSDPQISSPPRPQPHGKIRKISPTQEVCRFEKGASKKVALQF